MDALTAINQVRGVLQGLPGYLTGSSVAAALYTDIDSSGFNDVDVFTPTPAALIAMMKQLEAAGYLVGDSSKRVVHRWLKHGMDNWHTNSVKLTDPVTGTEVNLVYKLVDGHATTSLAQVVESFDFGVLAIGGWDLEHDTYRDMRGYFFPNGEHTDVSLDLPLLPTRRADWRGGFISRYQALRMPGRYARYVQRGYQLERVRDDFIEGYLSLADYMSNRDKPEKIAFGKIAESLADAIGNDEFDKLLDFEKTVQYVDDLDILMDNLQ